MSLTLNMVGGGGGGLAATDALLRVQAPAQSTVTITKGGVTKSDAGHENADDHFYYDYYFIIHASQFDSTAWTVTATLNNNSVSKTIVVNAADEYDLAFKAILPSAYQVVDYVTIPSGGQLITEYYPKWGDTYTATLMRTGGTTTEFFGALNGTTRLGVGLITNTSILASFYGNFDQRISSSSYTVVTGVKFDVFMDTEKLVVDGTTVGTYSTQTTFTTLDVLFRINEAYTTSNSAPARYYKLYVLRNGVKVADFVPCYRISDSVCGMYDTIAGSFFTNAGSGTITAGADV